MVPQYFPCGILKGWMIQIKTGIAGKDINSMGSFLDSGPGCLCSNISLLIVADILSLQL